MLDDFLSRKQRTKENIREFAKELQGMASRLFELPSEQERFVKDQIVKGIADPNLRAKATSKYKISMKKTPMTLPQLLPYISDTEIKFYEIQKVLSNTDSGHSKNTTFRSDSNSKAIMTYSKNQSNKQSKSSQNTP